MGSLEARLTNVEPMGRIELPTYSFAYTAVSCVIGGLDCIFIRGTDALVSRSSVKENLNATVLSASRY
jgi:hypothetical protein